LYPNFFTSMLSLTPSAPALGPLPNDAPGFGEHNIYNKLKNNNGKS